MKAIFLVFPVVVLLSFGCARVSVEAPKEPIKVDISMRLDIYQHISKDIDKIEDIVSGSKEGPKPKTKNNGSMLRLFLNNAYAQEALSPEVERAALNRRDRRSELLSWEAEGAVGENYSGLVEIRLPEGSNASLEELIRQENSDRMVIYKALAEKNSVSVGEIQRLYAQRLQEDAPYGTPIEIFNEAARAYEWRTK